MMNDEANIISYKWVGLKSCHSCFTEAAWPKAGGWIDHQPTKYCF
jgi:hypothetical protein